VLPACGTLLLLIVADVRAYTMALCSTLSFQCAGCLQVVTAGQYEITLYYQSDEEATFRLWVGPYSRIQDGTAMHLDARLPADVSIECQ
jgi:hypothetical protein